MIAEIIPQIRLPKSIGIFDYQVPRELELKIQVGQVVAIPFRQRKISGLVLTLKKTSSIKKPLSSILSLSKQTPLLTKTQINLIIQLTKYYLVSPALLIKSILPQIPKRVYKKDFKKIIPKNLDLKIAKDEINELKKVRQKIIKEEKPSLIHYAGLSQKILLYLFLINHYYKLNKQVAIIVPEMADIAVLYPVIARKFAKTAYYHGQLVKNEQYNIWQNILNGKIKVIIGTRPACFAPFKNLGLVIIDQEENESHKQYDQNPRYHVVKVIKELAKISRFKFILTSHSPSIDTYWQIKRKKIGYHNISSNLKIKLKIVDLNQTFKKHDFGFLSEELIEQITVHLKNHQSIFLYLNRLGMANRVNCADCGYIFTCPNCLLPLTSSSDLKLICNHCRYQEGIPKNCPHCHSVKIRFAGLGLEKIVANVKIIFSDIPIIGLSAINFDEQRNYSNYKIIVGTSIIIGQTNMPKFGLIGIINADSGLNYPDYRTFEKTYCELTYLINFQKEATVILQTFSPENLVIKTTCQNDYEQFFQKEIKNRKNFNYPPFRKLIKLIYQDSDQNKVKKETTALYQILKKQLSLKWIINEMEATPYLQHGHFRHLIIIRYSGSLPKFFIKLIPDNWIIDIDPINFE